MVAFKHIDYFLYFEAEDIALLEQGHILQIENLQHHSWREKATFCLKDASEMDLLSKKHEGRLVFSNETLFAVVHLSEADPTEHFLYFERNWFRHAIGIMLAGADAGRTIRWNGSGDKLTLLAGEGRESKHFKMLYGP